MNPVLATLLPLTFRQSDLAYRLGLLREFLEFCFFTQQSASADVAALGPFSAAGRHGPGDIGFLQKLSPGVFASFQSGSFHAILDQALAEAKALPTLRLTVAVILSTEEVAALGQWARQAVDERIMLEFSVDPEIGAGCQLLWHDTIHEYSLGMLLRKNEAQLAERIPALLEAA